MIVACTACQARFRVADEKIGPHGSRARCIRCGTSFVIPPLAAPPPAEPVPAPDFQEVPQAQAPTEPPTPAAAAIPERVPTGWTEAFQVAAESDPLPPAGPPEPAHDDPFAVVLQQRTPSPPPIPAVPADPFAGFGGPAVTNLADLERTGVRAMRGGGDATPPLGASITVTAPMTPAPTPAIPAPETAGGLSLEERTPVAAPLPPPVAAAPPPPDVLPEWGSAPGGDRIDPMPLADFEFAPSPVPPAPPPLPPPRRGAERSTQPSPQRAAGGPAAVPAPVAPAPSGAAAGPRGRSLAVNALSLAVLLAATAGIVLWWRGDDVARLVRRAGGGGGAVEVLEVTTGTYPAAGGQALLFVRGAVRTRSGGPVRVRAEMLRDGRVVGIADGLAGATPSPEDLAAVEGPADLERLRAALAERAAARSPGAGPIPFHVAFLEPAGAPSTVSFRVDAAPAPP